MDNMIVWADIPVTDLERAMKFYGAVLQHGFITVDGMPGIALPAPDGPPGAAPPEGPMPVAFDLAVVADNKPSTDGCTIYLNAEDGPERDTRIIGRRHIGGAGAHHHLRGGKELFEIEPHRCRRHQPEIR